MRYRALSDDGDYTFGQGQANFLINSPAAVGQLVMTRLLLFTGEWFLDRNEGMPWATSVLGTGTKALYDQAIREHVLETDGVTDIAEYSSSLADDSRHLSVLMTVNTVYGAIPIETVL